MFSRFCFGFPVVQDAPALEKAETPMEAARNGYEFYKTIQSNDGHWAGEYGGPLFLIPGSFSPCLSFYLLSPPPAHLSFRLLLVLRSHHRPLRDQVQASLGTSTTRDDSIPLQPSEQGRGRMGNVRPAPAVSLSFFSSSLSTYLTLHSLLAFLWHSLATLTPNRPSSEQLSTTSLFESSVLDLSIPFVRRRRRTCTRWEERELCLVGGRLGWRS